LTGRNSGHAIVRGNVGLLPYQENVKEPGSFPINASTSTIANLFKKDGYTTGVEISEKCYHHFGAKVTTLFEA